MATISKSGNILIKKITKMEEDNSIPFEYVITDEALLEKIKNVDGEGSGLDADTIDGKQTSSSSQPNVIPVTDGSGKIPNEFIDSENLGGGGSGAVTAPNISGPTSSKYGKDITLTASGSLTAFKDNGATIDHYEWLLPDDTIATSNSVTYSIHNDSSLVGETLTFKCKAVDTLGNESKTVTHSVEITAGEAPDIDSIEWSEDPPHHDNTSYTVTIHASDPDNDPLTYNVTCNDSNVTIEQDTNDPSKFNVTYPDYTEDTTVTFTYTVSDGTYDTSQQESIEVKDNMPPTIDQVTWDTDPPHYYGETYYVSVYATDPEGQPITYNVTCNDSNVTITQDTNDPHKFQVTYPNYSNDTTVTFTYHASDGIDETTQTQNVLVKSNKPPTINSWSWDGPIGPNEEHYENQSYDLTIDASDPENDTLSYDVTCNDNNVTITQNGTHPNIFHITYPNYNTDTNVTYSISVTDTANNTDTQTDEILVKNSLPIRNTGVFGGGSGPSNTIDYITISTLGNAQDFGDLTIKRSWLSATSNGVNDRGVFGGGSGPSNTIDYITISTLGNAQDFGDLTIKRGYLAATSNGTNNRGVFGGGWDDNNLNTLDYITISTLGNASDFGDLTVSRHWLSATSNGTNDRGVFGEGWNGSSYYNIIDYITISSLGNAHDFGDLTVSRRELAATSNGTNDRGVFGGGYSGYDLNTIDYITISSLGNAQDFGDLIVKRNGLAATSNGVNDRGVFGGGSGPNNIIDYITISTLGNAHDFGDLTVSRSGLAATSNA